METLFLGGAGGFGQDVCTWLSHLLEWSREWEFLGFLDDNRTALQRLDYPVGFEGGVADHVPVLGELIVGGIGDPRKRSRVCRRLRELGTEFPISRHPSSLVGTGCRIGEGTIICPELLSRPTSSADAGLF
jgi:hypothetical protein